jgi:hypothetical protein
MRARGGSGKPQLTQKFGMMLRSFCWITSIAGAVACALLWSAWAGGSSAPPGISHSSPEHLDYCIHVYHSGPKEHFIRLRIPRRYVPAARSASDCARVNGLNIVVSYPSMEPATRDMLDCVGDCSSLLWISLGNETGDPWKVAERSYHLGLLDGGELVKRDLAPWQRVKRISDGRFNESYETEPIGRGPGDKATWHVEKDPTGRVSAQYAVRERRLRSYAIQNSAPPNSLD